MEENMGDQECASLLQDCGLLHSIGSSLPVPVHHSEVKYFMTDIIVECVFNATNHSGSNMMQMNVEVVSDAAHETESLVFKRISPNEWKYDQIVELRHEVSFKALLDDMGQVGFFNLGKGEVDKFRSITGSTEMLHDFRIQKEGYSMLRLKFQLVGIPLNGDLSKETLNNIMRKDRQKFFSMVRDLPDRTVNKLVFLDTCGAHFLQSFEETQRTEDIDSSVLANRLALQHTPTHTARLNSLAVSNWHRFKHLGEVPDIIEAVSLQQKVVQLTPEGHADVHTYFSTIGLLFGELFNQTGDLKSISESISYQQMAMQLTPEGHENKLVYFANLGSSLQARFRCTGDLTDISEAISYHRKAVELTPDGNEYMPSCFSEIGLSLQTKFSCTGDLTYISEAISFQRKAVQLTPDGHVDMPTRLSNLGHSLQEKFSHTGELGDISEAISFQKKAVRLTPESNIYLPIYLTNLGISLRQQFSCTGELENISEAVLFQQKAVQLSHEGHANMPIYLSNLGLSLEERFSCTGELADISEAISVQQKAVQLAPEGHANVPVCLSNLGVSLRRRFSRTGELMDISDAISVQKKAVQLTCEGYAEMPTRLSNLGLSLRGRFVRTGELPDISEAISYQQKAIQLTPESHRNMSIYLSTLGASFQARFLRTKDPTDISEAISYQRKAVQLTPEGHTDMPGRLSNLGHSLQERFSCTGELIDISEAISFQQKAVQLTSEGQADMPLRLSNLGRSLQEKFTRTGEFTVISEAISSQEKAVLLTPEGHAYMPVYLSNLGISLQERFLHTGELTDISRAISVQEKAIQMTPDGHAQIARFMTCLAFSLASRFGNARDMADIQSAMHQLSLASNSNSAPPSIRLDSAKDWVSLSEIYDPSQLLNAHRTAIHLISRVAGMEMTIEKRHNNLIDISTLSSSAAAIAFASDRTDLALEWLEQGRCLVWNQLNDLRTPLESLRNYDPHVADELMNVSRALENAGSRGESTISMAEASLLQKSSLQDEEVAHVKLAQRWDQLLVMIRSIPEFADFLKPPSASALLQNLPNSGIVIVVNVHQHRCDALALRSGLKPVHIALPGFSYEKADRLRESLKAHLWASGVRMRDVKPEDTRGMRYEGTSSLKEVLSTLWISIVKPILDSLGCFASTIKEPPSNLLRIWWYASGPLAFLPIHAAGIYNDSGTGFTLADFAISSYTPTLRALVDIVKAPQEVGNWETGLFMISQPATPHLSPIPATTDEVRVVGRKLSSYGVRVLCLEGAAATVDQGIQNMKYYSSIHFACHAMQDTQRPLKSGFSLNDGRLELSSIIKQRLTGADLAFLSACQTSTGDEKLSEEAVHLAAGMLAAGYRSAVATMWSIRDEYGPIIAEDFYSNLMQDSEDLSGEYAARALHHATQKLRKLLGDSESALLAWVPYVHFGI